MSCSKLKLLNVYKRISMNFQFVVIISSLKKELLFWISSSQGYNMYFVFSLMVICGKCNSVSGEEIFFKIWKVDRQTTVQWVIGNVNLNNRLNHKENYKCQIYLIYIIIIINHHRNAAVTWLEYCRYGVKPKTINQSINHWNDYA